MFKIEIIDKIKWSLGDQQNMIFIWEKILRINAPSDRLSGISTFLCVFLSPYVHWMCLWTMTHYCECYCCLLLIQQSLSHSVLMIVWTLPRCYLEVLSCLSPAVMLFLAVASPLFRWDANNPMHIMNTDGAESMSHIEAYSSVEWML